jgi:hypothetical protein
VAVARTSEVNLILPEHLSRYETTLLAKIRDEAGAVAQSILKMKLAVYWFRRGNIEPADALIQEVRHRFASSGSAHVFAHINFAEAIREYLTKGHRPALEKMRRSKVFATGCPDNDNLSLLIAAWLASFYRVSGNWSGLREEVDYLFEKQQGSSPEFLIRCGLLFGDCYQEVEDYDSAALWYRGVHAHSIACGDEVSLSACLYNRAAIRLFNVRILEIVGTPIDLTVCKVEIEAASAINYANYVGDNSMSWASKLLSGQLCMLAGQHDEALSLFDSIPAAALAETWPGVDLVKMADTLQCQAALRVLNSDDIVAEAGRLGDLIAAWPNDGDGALAAFSVLSSIELVSPMAADRFRLLSQDRVDRFNAQRKIEREMIVGLNEKISSLLNDFTA